MSDIMIFMTLSHHESHDFTFVSARVLCCAACSLLVHRRLSTALSVSACCACTHRTCVRPTRLRSAASTSQYVLAFVCLGFQAARLYTKGHQGLCSRCTRGNVPQRLWLMCAAHKYTCKGHTCEFVFGVGRYAEPKKVTGI